MEQPNRKSPPPSEPDTPVIFTMETGHAEGQEKSLLRRMKPLTIMKRQDATVDPSVISPMFYNTFNAALLQGRGVQGLTVGVTSPHPRDGKTLVAANLALSLALATQQKTVLVDMHLARPQLHKVFGVSRNPGLLDAFDERAVTLWEIHVPDLYLLPAGTRNPPVPEIDPRVVNRNGRRTVSQNALRLDDLPAFRDILVSLRDQFEFIILDLPCIGEGRFPSSYGTHIDGYVVVVRQDATTKDDVDVVLRQMSESQLLGFVLNKRGGPEAKRWFR